MNQKMKQVIILKKIVLIVVLFPLLGSCSIFKKSVKKEEKRIIDYFISDRHGNRISKINPRKEKYFYLVIISENMIGEGATLGIEEEDEEVGYIHKGVYLGKEIRFKIRRNKQKLKMYIYDPKNKRHRRLKEKAKKKTSDTYLPER